MNHMYDVDKRQYQMFGDQQAPTTIKQVVPIDISLFRTLLEQGIRTGNEEAIKVVADMLEDLERRLRALESK